MERMIKICNILKKYCSDDYFPFFAEHDVIGFLVDFELISKEDIEQLTELRVYFDQDYYTLVIYT